MARQPNPVTLSADARQRAIASLQHYFENNFDEPLGDLKASLLLDHLLAEIAPAVYNQGLADAQHYLEERVSDVVPALNKPEFPTAPGVQRKK
jgi:uncharacterized protein (DUF2164 family)